LGRGRNTIADNSPMATKKPKGLGLGLEALLGPRVKEGSEAAPQAALDGAPSALRLEQLRPGKYQPRTRMDEGSLYELAESIKAQGVMQPVLVRPVGHVQGNGAPSPFAAAAAPDTAVEYEIIAGERRVPAARI